MKRIAICDDEIGTCSDLENMILGFANQHALQIETEVFYSEEMLYHALLEQCLFDLIFLDIQLFQLDGIQVGKQIREQLRNDKIGIVYISSKETYVMRLFQVRPLDFLLKPLNREKVVAVLELFIRLSEANKIEFYYHIGKSTYLGQGITIMDFFFFLVEIPFLLVISFFYQGKGIQRLLIAAIFPAV